MSATTTAHLRDHGLRLERVKVDGAERLEERGYGVASAARLQPRHISGGDAVLSLHIVGQVGPDGGDVAPAERLVDLLNGTGV